MRSGNRVHGALAVTLLARQGPQSISGFLEQQRLVPMQNIKLAKATLQVVSQLGGRQNHAQQFSGWRGIARRGRCSDRAKLTRFRLLLPARAPCLNTEKLPMPPNIRLIGAPTDIGAGSRGASMGPEAMRVAQLMPTLQAQGLTVSDHGNLSGPANPWQAPVDGYRHLPEVAVWNEAVHHAVFAALQEGDLPILLGGDHCLGIGSISAVARHCRATGRALRVLWLDAHADFNTNTLTPTGNTHGMPVAVLCGYGPEVLTRIGGTVPAIDSSVIRQIGIRSVDAGEKHLVHQVGLEVFDMRFIDEMGMRHTVQTALEGLTPDTHLHVSFDVDFLDASIAPGVATAVRGGPTYREAQLCMEMIADTGLLGSLDVMELNPALDVRNGTAELAVDLIESLFGKSTLMRRPPVGSASREG